MRLIEDFQCNMVQGAANPWIAISAATITGTIVGILVLAYAPGQKATIIEASISAVVAGIAAGVLAEIVMAE